MRSYAYAIESRQKFISIQVMVFSRIPLFLGNTPQVCIIKSLRSVQVYPMALNYIWIAFFVIAFVVALVKLLFFGDTEIFSLLINRTFSDAETGFSIALALTAVMSLWMGIMKIGEKGGMVNIIYWCIAPLFKHLFPDLPKGHPAFAPMVMNISANMLGLDNAATPLGLKAMDELQKANPDPDTASNAQIMFLVLNTSGLTLIPTSILALRAERGFADISSVFLPILLATFFSTLAGLLLVAYKQKINLLKPAVLAYLGGALLLVSASIFYFSTLEPEQMKMLSGLVANIILFSIIVSFILLAAIRKVNVYEAFVEGAKDGFQVAIKIIPFLIAILIAIGVFRESGALEVILDTFRWVVSALALPTEWVDTLPVAFMKPLSGSGARGAMVDIYKEFNPGGGADTFQSFLASIMQGSTETTFYVIAVYFGSVGIKRSRYAVPAGLFADLVGVIAAILLAYFFFVAPA